MPTVTVTVTDASGNVSAPASASWTVGASSPYKPFPGGVGTKVRMGMRTPDSERIARVAEVEAAPATRQLTAWRIFVEDGGWTSPSVEGDIIDWAISQGMLPVITYKNVNPSTTLQNQTADYLQSKGVPIAVGRWHEPRGDTALGSSTSAQQTTWRNMQAVSSPIFRARSNLSFGPIANGFLISTANGRTELEGWLPDADLAGSLYDWIGADFYQAAPDSVPSLATPWPGERMRDFAEWLDDRGFPDHRLLVGEFNGNHGNVLDDACEALLESDRYWLGMLFNSTTGNKGIVLTHDSNASDRLLAFQQGISDPRAYP
jgi:hypothetical protein